MSHLARDEADPASIPLASLRAPPALGMQRSESGASSVAGAPPPAHFSHPHGFDSAAYYEGYDAGNEPAPREHEHHAHAHAHAGGAAAPQTYASTSAASGSRSGSGKSKEGQAWGQFDATLRERKTAAFEGESVCGTKVRRLL
jgi:hypothetical protein